ncbi:hypothetical protein ES705_42520 [subsurface metagenome]
MSTTLHYPYHWGKGVVQPFVEKYARGTYYLAKLLGIAPGVLRHYLILILCSGNSLKYEGLKKLIKQNDLYYEDDLSRYSDGERELLYKRLRSMGEDVVLDEIVQNSIEIV